MASVPLSLAITADGQLYLHEDALDDKEFIHPAVADKIQTLFQAGYGVGLLRLGLTQFKALLSPSVCFWQQFSKCFITEICKQSSLHQFAQPIAGFPLQTISRLIAQAPVSMQGRQYLHIGTAKIVWHILTVALRDELQSSGSDVNTYLSRDVPPIQENKSISFHLVENTDPDTQKFSFWVSCFLPSSISEVTRQIPLKEVLSTYVTQQQSAQLLALLLPIRQAAEQSAFLKKLVDTGGIFQNLHWNAAEALHFLQDISIFEAAGIRVDVPTWWNTAHPPTLHARLSVGDHSPNILGLDALLDFNMEIALPDGERISPQELEKILAKQEKLVQVKGQWLQINSHQIRQTYGYWKKLSAQVKQQGLSWTSGLRFLTKLPLKGQAILPEGVNAGSEIVAGAWLKKTLLQLQHPEHIQNDDQLAILAQYLKTKLRPYQTQGVRWMAFLYHLKLGGCLADDMGLGKTVQLLALLLSIKHHPHRETHSASLITPHLLIIPASLLGNWQTEIKHFSPDLRVHIAHYSVTQTTQQPELSQVDLVITTYSMVARLPWLETINWDLLILDEAQAIKNPVAQQTRAIKLLKSQVRFILTGTPIENRLMDFWSLFDFIAPGLLGSRTEFMSYYHPPARQTATKISAQESEKQFHVTIRQLTSPYILRRLKNDKNVIQDLPDKTELQAWCMLSKVQVSLYQQAVDQLTQALQDPMPGIKRQGLILSYLSRFKQICNHPDQWFRQKTYATNQSGKFLRLQEISSLIADKQEKLLVFTQFREIIPYLCRLLNTVFEREGLYLHGKTSVAERSRRIASFQSEQGPPFFVLSLKAGGIGLNLTAASHVVHFDRWWNPAVEQQATDRAYRIGQSRNILVHKLICQGTIEEKIDSLIRSKQGLSDAIIGSNEAALLTKLSNTELIKVVSLDIHKALRDS